MGILGELSFGCLHASFAYGVLCVHLHTAHPPLPPLAAVRLRANPHYHFPYFNWRRCQL